MKKSESISALTPEALKPLEGKEETITVGQVEDVQNMLTFLKEEKAALLEKKAFSAKMIAQSKDKVKELQEKKEKFGDMALNVASMEKEIRAEDWSINYYPEELKSLSARIQEIDDRIARKEKDIETPLTR